MLSQCHPKSFTDYSIPELQDIFADAMHKVQCNLGGEFPLIIQGRRIFTEDMFTSINPSNKYEIVGRLSNADTSQMKQAIAHAYETQKEWAQTQTHFRARILLKAAEMLRNRKQEFIVWIMLEAGKVRSEADLETTTTIRLLEYYGFQMTDRKDAEKENFDWLSYVPLGVGVLMPSWNAPLSGLVDMVCASICVGNTGVLKPDCATPVIAYKFVELLQEAGLPQGVIQFVTSRDIAMDACLVSHQLIDFIAFNGSREAGLRLKELSGNSTCDNSSLKHFVVERRRKHLIFIDHDTNIEFAARSIVYPSFDLQGEQSVTCIQAFVHEHIYADFLKRCIELFRALKVGDSTDLTNDCGPVIDQKTYENTFRYIERASIEGHLLTGGKHIHGNGFFIQPTIIADLKPDANLLGEEVFGPVITICKVNHYEDFLQAIISNNQNVESIYHVHSNKFHQQDKDDEVLRVNYLKQFVRLVAKMSDTNQIDARKQRRAEQ